MSAENGHGIAGYIVSHTDRRSVAILIVAGGSVAGVVALIISLWHEMGDVQISTAGWAMMALGIVLTLAVGIGLMALVFISSRRGYDEPGALHIELPYTDKEDSK